jgi:hypothetical protein
MRNDSSADSDGSDYLAQIAAEFPKEHFSTARPGQQKTIRWYRVKGSKETEALNPLTNEIVDRNHSLGFQFAERDMNRPLIGAVGTQAIVG